MMQVCTWFSIPSSISFELEFKQPRETQEDMGSDDDDDFAETTLAAETSIVDNPQRVQAQFERISGFEEK